MKKRWLVRMVRLTLFLLVMGSALKYYENRIFQADQTYIEQLLASDKRSSVEILQSQNLTDEADTASTVQSEEVSEAPESILGTSYYYHLLSESEQQDYQSILEGVRQRKEEIPLSASEEEQVTRIYHSVMYDHPELYWAQNKEKNYISTLFGRKGCRLIIPYAYTEEEMTEINAAVENAVNEVAAKIPADADDYTRVQTIYTYIIDTAEYQDSEHDQNMAGIFWKKQAVCAGYARAVQYLLNRFQIPAIYVAGSTAGSEEGHAWNIVRLDGEYYYVDVTNGDQPTFLEGDAVQLAEHKTIIYDYLCPFPWEYELTYTPAEEMPVPACTATAKNFYVMNQGCFDAYDSQTILDYCKMRLDNGAAVIRFKFSDQEAFGAAYADWISGEAFADVAQYYMSRNGMTEVNYHYGVLENMMTMYFMF